MHIYVDESGGFVVPPSGMSHVSCVTALVIPSARWMEVRDGFRSLQRTWPNGHWWLGRIMGHADVVKLLE